MGGDDRPGRSSRSGGSSRSGRDRDGDGEEKGSEMTDRRRGSARSSGEGRAADSSRDARYRDRDRGRDGRRDERARRGRDDDDDGVRGSGGRGGSGRAAAAASSSGAPPAHPSLRDRLSGGRGGRSQGPAAQVMAGRGGDDRAAPGAGGGSGGAVGGGWPAGGRVGLRSVLCCCAAASEVGGSGGGCGRCGYRRIPGSEFERGRCGCLDRDAWASLCCRSELLGGAAHGVQGVCCAPLEGCAALGLVCWTDALLSIGDGLVCCGGGASSGASSGARGGRGGRGRCACCPWASSACYCCACSPCGGGGGDGWCGGCGPLRLGLAPLPPEPPAKRLEAQRRRLASASDPRSDAIGLVVCGTDRLLADDEALLHPLVTIAPFFLRLLLRLLLLRLLLLPSKTLLAWATRSEIWTCSFNSRCSACCCCCCCLLLLMLLLLGQVRIHVVDRYTGRYLARRPFQGIERADGASTTATAAVPQAHQGSTELWRREGTKATAAEAGAGAGSGGDQGVGRECGVVLPVSTLPFLLSRRMEPPQWDELLVVDEPYGTTWITHCP